MEVGTKKMEDKILKGKKIVVVDDDPHFRCKYASLAKELGAEVVMAEGVREGIEVILAQKPDAVITDKDMPDGSGNDVADAVKKAYADVPVAGITGGNPGNFNANVDIKLAKGINDENYKKLVQILVESGNPKEDFDRAMGLCPEAEAIQKAAYKLIAVDILVQGYILAEQVMAGVQPVKGVVLGPIDKENAEAMFDIANIGMTPENLLECYLKIDEGLDAMGGVSHKSVLKHAIADFVNNPDAAEFIDDLAAGKIADIIAKKQYNAFHEAFTKMQEAYND